MRAAPKTVQEISAVMPKSLSGFGVGGPGTRYPPGFEGVLVNSVVTAVAVVLANIVWATGTGADGPYPAD